MRVMRIRFHGGWGRKRLFSQNLAGGVIFWIANDGHTSAALDDDIPLGDALGGVVGTLGVNIGANFADQSTGVGLRKNYYRVHVA